MSKILSVLLVRNPIECLFFYSSVERPKSAKLRAVEDKVFSIKLDDVAEEDDDDDDDDDVTDEKIYEEELIAHQDESINVYEDKVTDNFVFLRKYFITLWKELR